MWLIIEDEVRYIIFCDNTVLSIVNTVPIALYSLLGYLLVLFFVMFSSNVIKHFIKDHFSVITTLLFVLPLMLIGVRTEVCDESIKLYNVENICYEEYRIENANKSEIELKYYKDTPSLTQLVCKICFENYEVELYSTFRSKYWKTLNVINDELKDNKVPIYIYGSEYIEDIKNYKLYDICMNYMYGVYVHIEQIEGLMQTETHNIEDS